eukprot:45739-Rhodomonas_salina.4
MSYGNTIDSEQRAKEILSGLASGPASATANPPLVRCADTTVSVQSHQCRLRTPRSVSRTR